MTDGVAEKKALLRDIPHFEAKLVDRNLPRRDAVDQDLPLLGIVNARDEIQQRTLTASRRADHAQRRSGGYREGHVAQHPARLRAVGRVVE